MRLILIAPLAEPPALIGAPSPMGLEGWPMKRIGAFLGLSLFVGSCGHAPTYAEGCGPPPKDWIAPRQGRGVLSALNIISVASDGSLTFNGVTSSRPVLANYLRQAGTLN